MSQSLQADPTTSGTLTLTCPLTGRSFSYDPTAPLEAQAIPQELRFGFRPGAEQGELWEVRREHPAR